MTASSARAARGHGSTRAMKTRARRVAIGEVLSGPRATRLRRRAVVEHREEPPRRLGRRDRAVGDRAFHVGQEARDVLAGEELPLEAVADHAPEPGLLLVPPLARELAGHAEHAPVLLDDGPDDVHAARFERAHEEDG